MVTSLIVAVAAALGWLAGRRAATTERSQLERASTLDPLTGLLTRTKAADHFAQLRRGGQASTLILLDLDYFKDINDRHGHRAGDQVLAAVAQRLAQHAHTCHGVAARLGGDEFVLVLPREPQPQTLRQVQAVLDTIAVPVPANSHEGAVTIHPSATAGVAVDSTVNGGWDALLAAADLALYHAKNDRRAMTLYQPGMTTPQLSRCRRRDTQEVWDLALASPLEA